MGGSERHDSWRELSAMKSEATAGQGNNRPIASAWQLERLERAQLGGATGLGLLL